MTNTVTPNTHVHPVDPERVDRAHERGLSVEDADRLTILLSLNSDPVRTRILYTLDEVEELCVGDLALALQASEDSVGYALRLLRRVVYHRLADGFPEPLRDHYLRRVVALTRTSANEED